MGLSFTRRLRDPIARGEVTCTVRFWQRRGAKVGGRYAIDGGVVVVTAMRRIDLADITPELSRRCGFAGVVDMLKIARHGPGDQIWLIEFEFEPAV